MTELYGQCLLIFIAGSSCSFSLQKIRFLVQIDDRSPEWEEMYLHILAWECGPDCSMETKERSRCAASFCFKISSARLKWKCARWISHLFASRQFFPVELQSSHVLCPESRCPAEDKVWYLSVTPSLSLLLHHPPRGCLDLVEQLWLFKVSVPMSGIWCRRPVLLNFLCCFMVSPLWLQQEAPRVTLCAQSPSQELLARSWQAGCHHGLFCCC